MNNPPDISRTVLVLSLWAETLPGEQYIWRGTVRTVDGKRMTFNTLQDLNRILQELSGWQDSSDQDSDLIYR